MLFRKRKAASEPPPTPIQPPPPAEVLRTLERLQKAGSQLVVRLAGGEAYTSVLLALGREAMFVDTLSPPEGDRLMLPGTLVEIESLDQGVTYRFETRVLGKVQYVDELPAFRLAYPRGVRGERRRKSPRVATEGDASLLFLRPFRCEAPVINVSEGGLAFEYDAELGRLGAGVRIRDILLELGDRPVVTVHGRVVAHVVAALGGLTLPRRYRASLAFEDLEPGAREVIREYVARRKGVDVAA